MDLISEIKAAMEAQGITQIQLAKMMGMKQPQVARMLNPRKATSRNTPIDNVNRALKVLGLELRPAGKDMGHV